MTSRLGISGSERAGVHTVMSEVHDMAVRHDGPRGDHRPGGRTGPHDRALGRWGEQTAAAHLERLGWQVLERNWRCDLGELDLVALDGEHPPTLVFVEVKARAGLGYGHPLEAITVAKQQKLRDLAWRWLREHDPHAARVRIDGIGVLWRPAAEPEIVHVRGLA